MAQIYILGTSNSVRGNTGYVQALRLHHDVTNRSSGRNTLVYHIAHILENRQAIEAHDILIIDHQGNDRQFYRRNFEQEYDYYLRTFYQLLATLNVPIVNLMFPRQADLFPGVGERVRKMADEFRFATIDLYQAKFRSAFFSDKIHINKFTSYMFGLFLSHSLGHSIPPRPTGGQLTDYPLRLVRAPEVAPDLPVQRFKNSVTNIEYVELDRERRLPFLRDETLASLGYFRAFDQGLNQGFVLDGRPFGVVAEDKGYFHELVTPGLGLKTSIGPVKGRHSKLKVLLRDMDVSGRFARPCLVNLLAHDPARKFSGQFANHQPFEIEIEGLSAGVEAAFAKANATGIAAGKAALGERPVIAGETIAYLRDTALQLTETDPQRAADLLALAQFLRPRGRFIARQLQRLREMAGP